MVREVVKCFAAVKHPGILGRDIHWHGAVDLLFFPTVPSEAFPGVGQEEPLVGVIVQGIDNLSLGV